jgi:hypothetical protein
MMSEDSGDSQSLHESPKHDMLVLRFRGDPHYVIVPYCEVANGHFTAIGDDTVEIQVVEKDKTSTNSLTFEEFVTFVEDVFDCKEITRLDIQPAETQKIFTIL